MPVPVVRQSVSVERVSRFLYIRSSTGLELWWDRGTSLTVEPPLSMLNHTCGLCGVYNNNPLDDFKLPDLTIALVGSQFGPGWQLSSSKFSCSRSI